MRPPRLIFVLLCFIILPVFLTCVSLLSAHQDPEPLAGPSGDRNSGGLRSLFSFHVPSSLFPPSAVISLTDDNSTFFLARPAAFGPLLPSRGLSGQLWIGNGFGDDVRKGGVIAGVEGELGCSDVPGWGEGDQNKGPGTEAARKADRQPSKSFAKGSKEGPTDLDRRTKDEGESSSQQSASKTDGTDDHLHHPLPESDSASSLQPDQSIDKGKTAAHADIQSLQESAEIAGKVVLLSRGGCGFLEKVKWVQRRGGTAVIVGDDTRGGGLVTMYARGDTSNVTIPALFTSHTTAHLLSSLIPPERSADEAEADVKSDKTSTKEIKIGSDKSSKTATKATKPSVTPSPKADDKDTDSASASRAGWLSSLLSLVGIGSDGAYSWRLPEDSRRPPSSGHLDWVILDDWDDAKSSSTTGKTPGSGSKAKGDTGKSTSKDSKADISYKSGGDGFVIGVQDWRDPDLIVPDKSTSTVETKTPGKSASNTQSDEERRADRKGSNLKGGSITPGSGEYTDLRVSNGKPVSKSSVQSSKDSTSGQEESLEKSWLSSYFGWGSSEDTGTVGSSKSGTVKNSPVEDKKAELAATMQASGSRGSGGDHEGLWVTLTPTSMSTSPFFDTLLVLVVSPLVTLTAVYALLLLRSRIRRRRWRAPKSVVDRLPVRTYQTMSPFSSTCPTPLPSSADSSNPSSPLLSNNQPASPRSRPRSQTTSGIPHTHGAGDSTRETSTPPVEKSNSGSTLWRRKYTSRQVECAVCLEEYVDGQSRVMSLPCGHEFHAECITPWLTTRRRTCPICKGDVVRSMRDRSHGASRSERQEESYDDVQSQVAESRNDSPSSAIPIRATSADYDSDLERGDGQTDPLLGGDSTAAEAQSRWRNLASLSLSALSGDAIWHTSRPDRSR